MHTTNRTAPRRVFIQSLALGAASLALPPAFGQSGKAVRIVVPFGPGGVADLTARAVGQQLAIAMGRPVVIDNKPGAGGIAAGELVARGDADGSVLLLMSNGTAVSAGLFKSLPFDTLRDFAPISTLGTFDIGIVTTAESRFKTLGELVAYGKANPGKLNLGTINIGSTQHLAGELFKSASGLDLQIVPFNGTPAVVTALRGGQIDAGVEILGPIMGQIGGGVLRVLAVTGNKRSSMLQNVPTAVESGLPGLVASSWNALAAPGKTPPDVVRELNKHVVAVLAQPELRSKLQAINVEAQSSTPEQTADLLASEIKRWGEVIQRAKIPTQ